MDGGPVGTDVWIKYIGDSFYRYQSSDAAPLTEVQDIYIILHINSECFAGVLLQFGLPGVWRKLYVVVVFCHCVRQWMVRR